MMSTNKKVAIYCRVGNIEQTINPNCIIYSYSKDNDALVRQEFILNEFCKSWLLKPKKTYKDLGGPNFLSNKSDLVKMLFENSNVDIIISSVDRLSRNIKELMDIEALCQEKNIRFFDISSRDFVLIPHLNIYHKKEDNYGL